MDVKFNVAGQYNNTPSFGRLKFDNCATNILKQRLRDKDWKTLNELIKKEEKNNLADINAFALDSNKLKIGITIPGHHHEAIDEGFFSGLGSPIGFIKSMCNKAAKLAKKFDNPDRNAVLKAIENANR